MESEDVLMFLCGYAFRSVLFLELSKLVYQMRLREELQNYYWINYSHFTLQIK